MGLRRRPERAEARAPKRAPPQFPEEPASARLLRILRILETACWPWHRNSGPALAEHLRQCLNIDLTRSKDPG